jgi:hypothetical protein
MNPDIQYSPFTFSVTEITFKALSCSAFAGNYRVFYQVDGQPRRERSLSRQAYLP